MPDKIMHEDITPAYPIITVPRTTVLFQYPFVAPTQTVTVKNPVFNDVEEANIQRVYRETRCGTMINYVDPSWPKVITIKWKFENLYQTDIDALIALFNSALGQYIKITDYLSREWKSIVLNPDLPSETVRRLGGHTLELSWEGELC